MSTIRVHTSQNIDVEYAVAGVGDRILSYLIDMAVYVAYIVTVTMVTNALDASSSTTLSILVFLLPVLTYQLACETMLDGQSLGKKALRIKVVSLNGERPTAGQYAIRWLFRIVDTMMGSGVVAVIAIAMSEKGQRIGDMLAGTAVVRTRTTTRLQDTIFSETSGDYTPAYPNVTLLNDRDISLLREVVNRAVEGMANREQLLSKACEKVGGILGVAQPGDRVAFLETVIRDYNHITGMER